MYEPYSSSGTGYSYVRLDFNPANYALTGLTDKDNSFSLSFYTQTLLWRLIILDTSASPPNVDWEDDFDEVWATSVAPARSARTTRPSASS